MSKPKTIMRINNIEKERRNKRELIVEGCKEMAEDSLSITKEWGTIDAKLDW